MFKRTTDSRGKAQGVQAKGLCSGERDKTWKLAKTTILKMEITFSQANGYKLPYFKIIYKKLMWSFPKSVAQKKRTTCHTILIF